ncbi:MAG: AraC family transcriptional regulator [Imperialibacter sp.]
MKPHFHKVPIGAENSFSIRHDSRPNFGTLWHYHPELELHYIVRGEGTQYIGDNVSNFVSGDMVFLGQNLPHTWRCKEAYFAGDENVQVEAYVLHFHPTCFGKDFLSLPEAYLIPRLFEKAKKGLKIHGESKARLIELLDDAAHAESLDRVIYLLSILKVLSETDEFETIAPAYAFSHLSSESEMVRLEKIYSYVLAHYKEKITLEEVASLANLSLTSFCRYFKTMTKKTFSDFLTEIRISNVCRAIVEDKLPTEVICFECGFNNVSNFYRHFKKVTGMTPFEYKKKYLAEG